MAKKETAMRVSITAAVLICGFTASALAQQPAPTVVPVGTVAAERKPITKTVDFVGRIQAIDRVARRMFHYCVVIGMNIPNYRVSPE